MGAIQSYLAPRLAQDSAIDLRPILRDVTAKNFSTKRPLITTEIRRAVAGNLAQDADVEDLPAMLDQIESLAGEASQAVGGEVGSDPENPMVDPDEEEKGDEPPPVEAEGESDKNEIEDFLRDKLSPEDLDTVCAMMKASKAGGAIDEESDEDKEKREMEAGNAMDSRIADAIAANDKKHAAIADALRAVRPWTGELNIAFDSADQVYRHTLTALGVAEGKTAHKDALTAILAVQPKPGVRVSTEPRLAHDAAAAKGFAERFPSASRIGSM
jgi:Ni,Fe-hydrogenase III component G